MPPQKPPPSDLSHRLILYALGAVEGGLAQAEASREQIRHTAGTMRDGVQQEIDKLEQGGLATPDDQASYQEVLLGRRSCDLVGPPLKGYPGEHGEMDDDE